VSAAKKADVIYAASFVTANATVRNVLRDEPALVTIVAMGWNGKERSDEDELCALYIRNLLQRRRPDKECVRRLALAGADSQKFGNPALPHFHPKDRDLALQIDAYDFAIRVKREGRLLVARREA
jgi:2-phosphosulfolactate phosphatase